MGETSMDWKIIRSKKVWLSVAAAIVMSAFCFLADMQQEGVAAAAAVEMQAGSSEAVRGAEAGTGEDQTGAPSSLRPLDGSAAAQGGQPRTGWAVRFGVQVYYDRGRAVTDRWVGDYYLGENGVLVKDSFLVYKGLLYHVGEGGACDRGRFYAGDREYYANEDGVVYSSDWVMDGEDWVYVDEGGLVMKNDITPDGYLMDENGHIIDDGYSGYEGFRYSDKNLRLNTGAADLIWTYLKKKGWTDTAIAGMLGNFQQESHLSPSLVESNGIGFGLGQWSFERRTGLEAYAKGLDKPVNDLYMQLDYLTVEPVEGAYVRTYMKTDFSSPAEAAIAWCNNWERPNKAKARLGTVRIPYAMAYYEHYVNGVDYLTEAYVYEEPLYLEDGSLEGEQGSEAAKLEYTPLTDEYGNPTLGWIYDAGGWWYRYPGGGYAKDEWKKIDGEWYYFGPDGYMESGRWITDQEGRSYQLDDKGHIIPQEGETYAETAPVIVAGGTATGSDAVAGQDEPLSSRTQERQ